MEWLFHFKTRDTVKEKGCFSIAFVVGLSSWIRSLACGKENGREYFL